MQVPVPPCAGCAASGCGTPCASNPGVAMLPVPPTTPPLAATPARAVVGWGAGAAGGVAAAAWGAFRYRIEH
eukprot:1143349-Pelagomonas_calceolata.AAC.4